jgi:hypothetical protein
MMNCKGRDGKCSWPNLRYYTGIFLEGLRRTTNISVGIVGVQAEIRSEKLSNTSQNIYTMV